MKKSVLFACCNMGCMEHEFDVLARRMGNRVALWRARYVADDDEEVRFAVVRDERDTERLRGRCFDELRLCGEINGPIADFLRTLVRLAK